MRKSHLCFILPILALLTACQTMYIPPVANVPLMSGGDETQVAATIGTNGYGGQLAYSPFYRWTITAGISNFAIVQDTNLYNKYRNTFGEIGTGYYTKLSKFVRFETILGYGIGAAGINLDKERFNRFYCQPSIGLSSAYLDAAFTPRFAYVKEYEKTTNGITSKMDESSMYFEPSATIRVGYEQMKFMIQAGYAIPFSATSYTYRPFTIAFGAHLTFVKDFDKYK